jgi:dephospho-CoA kinase
VRVIGLTGGIGSGKSAAAEVLAALGAVVIDADRVGHETYQPGTAGWERVVDAFGRGIVAADGSIDRKRLGAIVFGDPTRLAVLNAIVHPLIRDAIATRIGSERAAGRAPAVVVEAALLVEAGWDAIVDEVWLVRARPDIVEERLVLQRGLDRAAIAARARAQLSDDQRRAHADVVIDNDGSRAALGEAIAALWRQRIAPA